MKHQKTAIAILIAIIALLAICIHGCKNDNQCYIIEDTETVSNEQCEYAPTIESILQEREDMKYLRMIDSTYLAIPTPILIYQLNTNGTTQSIMEIAEDFINNREYYMKELLPAIMIYSEYNENSVS